MLAEPAVHSPCTAQFQGAMHIGAPLKLCNAVTLS